MPNAYQASWSDLACYLLGGIVPVCEGRRRIITFSERWKIIAALKVISCPHFCFHIRVNYQYDRVRAKVAIPNLLRVALQRGARRGSMRAHIISRPITFRDVTIVRGRQRRFNCRRESIIAAALLFRFWLFKRTGAARAGIRHVSPSGFTRRRLLTPMRQDIHIVFLPYVRFFARRNYNVPELPS